MSETIFRIAVAVIIFTAFGISFHFRIKADRVTGEKIPRKVDGRVLMIIIKIGGLILWMSPIAYILNPNWMTWSKIGFPDWTRLLGIFAGIGCVMMIYWLFSHIGSGISPTSATRKNHILVTSGPYRWIRHPLYSIGSFTFVVLGIIADNWFIIILGILVFIIMAIRTPREESNLVDKFGEEYRDYMERTGRFFPGRWLRVERERRAQRPKTQHTLKQVL